MPDPTNEPTGQPSGAMRKMSLTEKERQLIEAHRAKTAVDRAFNAGLNHAFSCIPGSLPANAQAAEFERWSTFKDQLQTAMRDV